MIPSDVESALRYWSQIDSVSIPETARKTLGQIGADLLDTSNNDWRTTCKRIEWVISWGVGSNNHRALVGIVRALGYVGLASVLVGDAAKGLCTVTFEDGRLYMQGPNNRAGRVAIKAIGGRRYHEDVKPRWSVPAIQWESFQLAIWSHWPKFKGLEDAIEAAKAHTTTVSAPKSSLVTVSKRDGVFKVHSPYNARFIEDLKDRIKNWRHRRWNSIEKVWEVAISEAATLQRLIRDSFGEDVALAA